MYWQRFVLLSLTVVVGSAWATTVNINDSERGNVCAPINNLTCPGNNGANPGNTYAAGALSASNGSNLAQFRDWFEFTIPSLTGGSLTSATLSLNDGGHVGGNLTYSVYGLGGQPMAFGDVITTSPYGSVGTTNASGGTTIAITLNAAALAAITADQGGNLFLGGIDSAENNTAPCSVAPNSCVVGEFIGTMNMNSLGSPNFDTVLTLTTAPAAVPEPSSAALVGTMIVFLVSLVRWRQKARAH